MSDQNYQPPPGPPPSQRYRQGWNEDENEDDYEAPPGPPPSHLGSSSNQHQEYAPPPGPPPGHAGRSNFASSSSQNQEYAPPPGPPPGHRQRETYDPPLGPPPSHRQTETYEPPPGPPPTQSAEQPPPYHDWQSIPDTSTLPPPPCISYDYSPAANATKDDADRAAAWCRAHPLWQAKQLTPDQLRVISMQTFILVKPPSYIGDLFQSSPVPGLWQCRTASTCPDSTLQTALPIYSALSHSPLVTEVPKTIYFEVTIGGLGRSGTYAQAGRQAEIDSGLALGFVAPPYPGFRLPGWQRGSVAVHGDDGRRYVANAGGGVDFARPFRVGETLGIGMTFAVPHRPPPYGLEGYRLDVQVFFTRDGRSVGGWDLHEERDLEDHDVAGLEGECDLFPAVGVFGGCDFEVKFLERDWLYHPKR